MEFVMSVEQGMTPLTDDDLMAQGGTALPDYCAGSPSSKTPTHLALLSTAGEERTFARDYKDRAKEEAQCASISLAVESLG